MYKNEEMGKKVKEIRVMVRMGMKVSVDVSCFPINLVGEGATEKRGDDNIQKGKRVFILDFDRNLIWSEMLLRWLKKEVKVS
jgi:hypothetical protein